MNKGLTDEQHLSDAVEHLRNADPVLSSIITDTNRYNAYSRRSSFESLVRIVIGQQLSTSAARTIFLRVKSQVNGRGLTAGSLLEIEDSLLQAAGVSRAKLRTIRDLAQQVESGNLNLRRLTRMDNDGVEAELTRIKGVGPWTVQMYLMFVLRRSDVFPGADTGIVNAIQSLYGKRMRERRLNQITERWRPYRTVACWYLWRFIDLQKTIR